MFLRMIKNKAWQGARCYTLNAALIYATARSSRIKKSSKHGCPEHAAIAKTVFN